jgi:hypothetical protein
MNAEPSSNYGMTPPKVQHMPPGTSGVHSAGIALGHEKTNAQLSLIGSNDTVGGGTRRGRRGARRLSRARARTHARSRTAKKYSNHRMKRRGGGRVRRNRSVKIAHRAKYNRRRKSVRRTARGGTGGGQIAVNTMHVPYTQTGADGQTVNGTLSHMTETAATAHANRQYDSCVGQTPEECGATTAT